MSRALKTNKQSGMPVIEDGSNLQRMIRLADDFFDAKSDPSQISVNEKVMMALKRINPSTMTERRTSRGPIAWGMVIPTTHGIMQQFLAKQITERQLLRLTRAGRKYDSLYLCSALVLPEFRRKGHAEKLLCKSVREIRKDHPIESLFYWSFSTVGTKLAKAIGKETDLPLFRRKP